MRPELDRPRPRAGRTQRNITIPLILTEEEVTNILNDSSNETVNTNITTSSNDDNRQNRRHRWKNWRKVHR